MLWLAFAASATAQDGTGASQPTPTAAVAAPADAVTPPAPTDAIRPPGASANDPASTPAANTAPPDVHAEVRVDLSEGGHGQPDSARGWDERPGVETRDTLLWLPRVLLWAPNLVLKVAFLPIQGALMLTDRYALDEWAKAILYWNEAETMGWYPTIAYSTSTGFSGGASVFHGDLLGYDEELKAKALYGGSAGSRYEAGLEADRFGGTRLWLGTKLRWESSEDRRFMGVGMGAPELCSPGQEARASVCETRYGQDRFVALQRVGYTSGQIGSRVKVGTTVIYNHRVLGPSEAGEPPHPSIEEVYALNGVVGFDDDIDIVEWQGNVVLDFQATQGLNSAGLLSEMFVGHTLPVDEYRYVHYGAMLTETLDLYRSTRLLMLRAQIEGVHDTGGEIPMVALPRLGGSARLRGYSTDQFRDNIAAVGTVAYLYPIHELVQGQIFVDYGSVAPKYGELFDDSEHWKLGVGGGFIIGNEDKRYFGMGLAYGDGLHFFLATDLVDIFGEQAEEQ